MKLSPTDRHTSCVVSPVHKGLERKLLSRRSRWLKNLGMRCDPPRTGLGVMHHLATTLKTPDNRQPRHFSLAAMFNWLKLPLSGNHHKLTSQNGEQSEVEQFRQKSNKSVTELLSFLSRLVSSWVNYVQERGFSTWSSWQKGHCHWPSCKTYCFHQRFDWSEIRHIDKGMWWSHCAHVSSGEENVNGANFY